MTKELYMQAHEELIGQYLEDHPEATEAEAYDKTADRAYDRMVDTLANTADRIKNRMKEEGTWGASRNSGKPK